MYELVIINGDKEDVVFVSESLGEVELRKEQFLRGMNHGVAEIRPVDKD